MFEILIFFVVIGAVAWNLIHQRKQQRLMDECAAKLGVEGAKTRVGSLTGTIRGMPIEMKLVGSTKNTPAHVTVEVTIPKTPFLLHLRRQNAAELEEVRKGHAVDLEVGDPTFDGTWIVEGAPPERVLRVLADPGLRARLAPFSNLDTPSLRVEDGKVMLYRRGTEMEQDRVATERIELAVAMAEAVRADSEMPLAPGEIEAGSGYRTARRVDPDAKAAAQVAELKVLRATRTLAQLRIVSIGLHSLLTLILIVRQLLLSGDAFGMVPILIFGVIASVALVAAYGKEVSSAPGVPRDTLAMRWIAASWVINAIVVAKTLLVR